MNMSIDTIKSLKKTLIRFYDKTLNKLKAEGNCLNIIKKNTHLKDPQQTSHLALKD